MVRKITMDKDDELSLVKADKKKQQLALMLAGLDELRNSVGPLREYAIIMAEIKMDKYNAYTGAGFSEEQALQLVIGDGDSLL